MTKKTVLQWLQDYADMRERKNKNKWIGALVFKRHGIELTPEIKSKLDDVVSDILGADRYWRKNLEEHPELREKGYEEKERLEQQWMLDNGYEVGYHRDIRNKI